MARQCNAALPFQYLNRGVEMAITPTADRKDQSCLKLFIEAHH